MSEQAMINLIQAWEQAMAEQRIWFYQWLFFPGLI